MLNLRFMKLRDALLVALFVVGSSEVIFAQTEQRTLGIEEITQLAMANHPVLQVGRKKLEVDKQKVEVAQLQKLPNVKFDANAFYLSDALILDGDWSKVMTAEMPHFGNNFALQATQLVYKGGLVKKAIEAEELQVQLGELDLEKDVQAIKFLVISNYLDLIKLQNQEEVYQQNRQLAEERMKNIRTFYEQGMVTHNEVIRAELQLKSLDQALLTIKNNRHIINYQLVVALGLPHQTEIITQPIAPYGMLEQDKDFYKQLAVENSPVIKSSQTTIDMAKKGIEIIKTDQIPTVALFSGYSMQRPLLNKAVPMDVYSNTWNVGVSISYNIDQLYKTKTKIKQGEFQLNMVSEAQVLQEKNLDIEVESAYIKFKESIQQAAIYDESRNLAKANYKIIEAKYMNQLALLIDMIDASNEKLSAELQLSNAQVAVLFQYYKLIKTTGTL